MNVKWLFFDVGSTLIDETDCYNQRIYDAISGTEISFEEFSNKRIEFTKQNKKGDIEAIKYFGLIKTPWHKELEKPYPGAENLLRQLSDMGYKIGIIANQSAGTAKRLEKWGLMRYLCLVLSSAEEGVAKPDAEIFLRALRRTECEPHEAVMIGDRLDNDIYPAKKLGMKTIWVKQGIAAYQNPQSEAYTADFIVNSLEEIIDVFK